MLSLQPAYDDDSIAWDAGLVGNWRDADDNSSMRIEAAEWRLYRIHYEHPSEKGDVTGVLTVVGDQHYLDLMPARGEDHGSFLLPAHAVLRVELTEDRLLLTPLSYDWFAARMRGRRATGGLSVVFDQKQNVLITSATPRLRSWLRAEPRTSAAWGAPASFERMK